MNQFLFQATKIVSAIWQVSDNFPEILKKRIKSYSLDFLDSLSFENYKISLLYLKSLDSILKVATNLGFLRLINYEILSQELGKIKEEIVELTFVLSEQKEPDLSDIFRKNEDKIELPKEIEASLKKLPSRQKAIFDFLRKNRGQAKISEILEVFPDISSRTIRYDLQELCIKNLLERVGEGRGAIYKIKVFKPEIRINEKKEKILGVE